jgi:glutamine amidotransferase
MSAIVVIDYGMGNLRSVAKALEHVAGRQRVTVSADHQVIRNADRIVFPGQGAARDCMAEINRLHLDAAVREAIAEKPFLGICMGLQVLMQHSEENEGTDCLGLMPGTVRRFDRALSDPDSGARLKVPHMGWNQVHRVDDHPLWQGIAQDSRFYFVHSYYVDTVSPDVVSATTDYGIRFTSVIARDNLFAAQFHPEKSQHAGLTLLENFVNWNGRA